MRFSILLVLGLCAFTSATFAPRDLQLFAEVPEIELIKLEELDGRITLPAFVTDFYKSIAEKMNLVLSAFKDQSELDQNEIEAYAQAVQMDAFTKIDEILAKITELINKGGKVGECARQEQDKILEVTDLVGDGLKECARDIVLALKDLSNGILGKSARLIASINELKEIAKYCMNKGKIGMAFCFTGNSVKAIRITKEIISEAQAILAHLQANSGQLIEAAKNCNNNHIQVIFGKLKVIKSNVEMCIQ